jgi:phosphoglycolate phosphatase-like HAD superfamily hydrolase
MFDEKAILARLQNGEDAQAIANEMADMINKANKMYTDELAKAEEAKRAEEQKQAVQKQKMADLQAILDEFALWFQEYYGIDAGDELKAESIMELIDGVQEYLDALKGLETMFSVKNATKPAVKVVKKASADDTINQFLKQMGW